MLRITEQHYKALTGQLALPGVPAAVKPKRKYKTEESKVLAAAMGWLKLHGVFAWRQNSGAFKTPEGQWVRFGVAGCPDILFICKSGRWGGAECKGSKGELRPEQIAFRNAVMQTGGLYIVVRSIEDLQRYEREITGR